MKEYPRYIQIGNMVNAKKGSGAMLKLNADLYQKMYGTVGEDTKGRHLCSCACICSCHCRCGRYVEDNYEDIIW